ncbi:hypothetical protein ACFL4F_03015, partial [Candidatus Margulisiibacteriota bacterium]
SGGKCDMVLPCGNAAFPIALAEQTQRWVIGIDEAADQMFGSEELSKRYENKELTFIYLPYSHKFIQDVRKTVLSWLNGAVHRTHLNMPDTKNAYIDEVALWRDLASKDGNMPGELHLRAANHQVPIHLKGTDSFKLLKTEEIPLDEEAKEIDRYLNPERELHTLGIRLVV